MRTAVLAILTIALGAAAHAQTFGRERTMRSLATSRYEVNISKAGRVDIRFADLSRFIEDAWAGVQLAGDSQPRKFKLDARRSQRDSVSSRIGQGKSMSLGDSDFVYAISSYETQSFLTLRVAYINDTKKPQVVERIVVLAGEAGEESGLMLGAAAHDAKMFTSVPGEAGTCETVPVTAGSASGFGQLAAWNPASGRMLIAGFLGAPRGAGRFSASFSPESTETTGGAFSFDWLLPEPVTLEPGQRLEIPPLYLCVAGGDPIEELRRFGRALEIMGGTPPTESCTCGDAAAEHLARLAFLPANWKPHCAPGSVHEESSAAALIDLLQAGTAMPLDLFENAAPSRWRAVTQNASGEWVLYLLFNGSGAARQESIPLPSDYQTVYDYSQRKYLGTAAGKLDVEVLPGEARVLGFRPYADRPMIIAAGHHGAAGAIPEIVAHAYDEATGTLSITSEVTELRRLEYHILLPEGMAIERIQKSQGEAEYIQEGRVVTLTFTPATNEAIQWVVVTKPGANPDTPPTIHLPE